MNKQEKNGDYKIKELYQDEIKEILFQKEVKFINSNFGLIEVYGNIGKSIIEKQNGNQKGKYNQLQYRTYQSK